MSRHGARRNGRLPTGASGASNHGLAAQALLKWVSIGTGASDDLHCSKKDASEPGYDAATIMALRLCCWNRKRRADVRGTVLVLLNGKPAEKLVLTPENNDLLHQFVFKTSIRKAPARLKSNSRQGGLPIRCGSYFLPWDQKRRRSALH